MRHYFFEWVCFTPRLHCLEEFFYEENSVFNLFKTNRRDNSEILSPVTGTVHPLSECEDRAFSGGALGEGVIFRYEGRYVVAPCSGVVAAAAKTNHCVSLVCDNGAEMIIHVGFDTVMLNGKGLTCLVSRNQRVRAGQRLIEIDREYMEEHQIDLTTPMVITNTDAVDFEIKCSCGQVAALRTVIMSCKLKQEG